MYSTDVQVRVRYAETDQMGVVYYGNYATYLEVARVECFRNLGFTYKRLEAEGIMMPVLELHSKYRQPAYYDDLLTIKVTIPMLPTVSILFDYDIYNEQKEVIHTAQTKLCFIAAATNKLCRPHPEMVRLLQPYFKGQ